VGQARYFDDQGSHTFATWLYNLAYRQSGNDETVAIELAEQYRSMGNYTKAEYTLSNAIADGGTVELYIALCDTYVEQDKLLDAVTMLDNVGNDAIKQQLDALRPQAPTATPDHGYYNEYISVSLSVPEGKIYVTTDDSYPSTSHAPYSVAIPLNGGETTIHALTVGENGLVSPLIILDYTVAGVIEEITLTDPAIDSAVREALGVDQEHTLYSNELWNITSLTLPNSVKSLSDLSYIPFLTKLTIDAADLESLSPLSSLSSLEELTITDSTISGEDLHIIASVSKLTRLTMTNCRLSGISALSAATNLTYLDLGNNTIRDLSALAGMTQLAYLDLNHNAVKELDVLGGMKKLKELDLSYNAIDTAVPLGGCTGLTTLDLTGNSLTTTEGLENLTALQTLSLAFNKLTDVSTLANNTALIELDISNNSIEDITALNTLNALQTFNFSYNQVSKLPAFSKDSALVTIKGSQNNLSSVDELKGLLNLNYVMMDYNSKLKSIDALANCFALVEVSVYGTKVSDVSALTSKNIIVKYAPFMG
jgi:internalin A